MKAELVFCFVLIAAPVFGAGQQTPAPQTAQECACEAKPAGIAAIVNSVKIPFDSIDAAIQVQLKNLRQRIADMPRYGLDAQINKLLLADEATRRKTPAEKLLDAEIGARLVRPAEPELLAFYKANQSNIAVGFEQARSSIADYLLAQRKQEIVNRFIQTLRDKADVVKMSGSSSSGGVLARVNGHSITSADVEEVTKPLIFETEEQIYELRQNQLEEKINEAVLEARAAKEKVTPDALVQAEVTAKIKPVTDADAQEFYASNQERMNGSYAQVKDEIIEYLKEEEKRAAQQAFTNKLRETALIQVFLEPPELPVYNIALKDRPSLGRIDAPVTVVEFTDFQCPSCARMHPLLQKLLSEYPDKVRLVVKNFPLNQHPDAVRAAEAAEAARSQGKFWEFVALLYQNQEDLGVSQLHSLAGKLGLDLKKFDEALSSGIYAKGVKQDRQEGEILRLNSTPSLFVNGRPVRELDYAALKSAVEKVLEPSSHH